MIDFLNTEQDYFLATTELDRVFKRGLDIVENPFNIGFTIFRAFEFDRIYGANFYHGLIDFLVKRDSKEFTFYTLLPNPVEYFFSYFSKYSIGRILASASHADFWDFLNADPGNPADSLMDNAETIAMYSNEPATARALVLPPSVPLVVRLQGSRNVRKRTVPFPQGLIEKGPLRPLD